MSTVVIYSVFKPFLVLVFLGMIVLPIKIGIDKLWPDGRVKAFLYKKRGK